MGRQQAGTDDGGHQENIYVPREEGGGMGRWDGPPSFIDLYSTRSSAGTGGVLATGRILAIKLN